MSEEKTEYGFQKDTTKEMASIRAAEAPPMISFHSEDSDFFEAFPYHDIRRISYSRENDHRIEMEFWRYLVVLEGTKLSPLVRELSRHRIAEITESEEQDNVTGVQKIIIALLRDEEAEEKHEDY